MKILTWIAVGMPITGYPPHGMVRKKGSMYPGQTWLFPGYRGQHMSTRQLHRLVRMAAARAGVTKRVGVHTLRHSFATHLLEQKTDIRVIKPLTWAVTQDPLLAAPHGKPIIT
jgi:integrase